MTQCNDQISLVNVGLKIISKTPSEKSTKVLTDLISSQQTGYLKSRQIDENGRLRMQWTLYNCLSLLTSYVILHYHFE